MNIKNVIKLNLISCFKRISLFILYLAKYNLVWMTALFRSGSPFNK